MTGDTSTMTNALAGLFVVTITVVAGCAPASTPASDAKSTSGDNREVDKNEAAEATLPLAIERGLEAIARGYSKTNLFDDGYLRCEGQPACTREYRRLDLATLLLFWLPKAAREAPPLAPAMNHARAIMEQFRDRFRNAPLHGDAIDLYALFPYYFPGPETDGMLRKIIGAMSPTGDWAKHGEHGRHPYRKITDEMWLIAALAAKRVDAHLIRVAWKKKRAEAGNVLRGKWRAWPDGYRYYALTHIMLSYLWSEPFGYEFDDADRKVLREIDNYLAAHVTGREVDDAKRALTIYLLSLRGHPDQKLLAGQTERLVASQAKDGRWHTRAPGKSAAWGWSHATIMALVALHTFRQQHAVNRLSRERREWSRLIGPATITKPPRESDVPGLRRGVERTTHGDKTYIHAMPVWNAPAFEDILKYRDTRENSVLFFGRDELVRRLAGTNVTGHDRDRLRTILHTIEEKSKLVPNTSGVSLRCDAAKRVACTLALRLRLYGPGATPALGRRVKRSIESVWRGSVAGRTLRSQAVIELASRRTPHSLTEELRPAKADALPVFVHASGSRGASTYTRRHGDDTPTISQWPANISDTVIAHEIGHFLGFPDEYRIEERGNTYWIVCDEPAYVMSCGQGVELRPRYLDALFTHYLAMSTSLPRTLQRSRRTRAGHKPPFSK